MWELQASVSADGFRGHISPEEMKEVAAKITKGEAGLTQSKVTTQTHLKQLLKAKKVTFDTTNTLAFH